MNQQSTFEPSNLQMFIAQITGRGESNYAGVEQQLSLRVQGHLYAKLTAVTALQELHANQKGLRVASRNKILNELLAIAFDAVYDSLTEEDKNYFNEFLSLSSIGMLQHVDDEDAKKSPKNKESK
jgi:hypothetical protein